MTYYPFSQETSKKFNIKKTSGYGWRRDPINGRLILHDGNDFAPTKNRDGIIPITATVNGKCLCKKDSKGALYTFIIGDNGENHMTMHHKKFLINNGDTVKIGQEIALMGTTGHSTGVHTHFEVRKRPSIVGFDPGLLIYYEKSMFNMPSLDEALAWNNAILDKNLTSGKITLEDDNVPSKLINEDPNTWTEDQKYTFRLYKAYWDAIPATMYNTRFLDTMHTRGDLYGKRSTAR